MSKFFTLITSVALILSVSFVSSCTTGEAINKKVSSLLLSQVSLRKEQIAEPTPERLEMMKRLGMRVDNLQIQRIFIHLTEELNSSQIEELEAMGITLYLDSWIPAVGDHPTGFLIADMPINKLEKVAI